MIQTEDRYAKGMVQSGEEHYDLTPELDRFQYRMIRPYIAGKKTLEIGAGPGRIARLVLKENSLTERYVISEPSDHFYKQLRGRTAEFPNAEIVQGETSDLAPKFKGAFDTIFSVHVLEHVENDRQFLIDCHKMLRDGGKVVTLVPALQFLYSDLDKSIGHYRRYDKKMVRNLVRELGFEIERMYYTNFIAVFASLIFFKMRKLDYQKNEANKKQFVFLEKIYSRYFIPVIDLMERFLPVPVGLNLTFVLRKTNP